MSTKHYIGYGTLESLLAAPNEYDGPTCPRIYMDCVEEPGKPGRFGVALNTMLVFVARIDGPLVRYCRIPLGRFQASNGEPLMPGAGEKCRLRARLAFELLKVWIRGRGWLVEEALVATPLGARLLDGWALCLKYDKVSDSFTLVEEESEVVN